MGHKRNFLPLGGLLVCIVALVSYPFFFVSFPATRDVPWVNWLLFTGGLVLLGGGLVRAYRWPERYRGRVMAPVLGALGVATLGFFIFITEVAPRQLPSAARAPSIGEQAPDFTLPDAHGRLVRLSDLLQAGAPGDGRGGSWVLLIFYRGYW